MSDNYLNGEGYGRRWTEIAAEMEETVSPAASILADRLCSADRPVESVQAILDQAGARFRHSILFRVQDGTATVWDWRGWVDQTGSFVRFAASAVSGNPLELLTIYPNFRGDTPIEQAYVPFFAQLGLPFPRQLSLTPVEVAGRLVGILYGDNGENDRLDGAEKEDLELAARLSLGLTLVLIKNKIRAFGDA